MVRWLLALTALMCAAPAGARAAELGVTDGALRYTARTGFTSNVTFTETSPGTVVVTTGDRDDDGLTAGTGCTRTPPITCSGVTRADIDTGDKSDRVTAALLTTIPATISGGAGNDAVTGGARNDTIDGDAGDDDLDGSTGNDVLRGGDGNDVLRPNTGSDAMTGGDGIDTAVYGFRPSPVFTLDGLPNDGEPGESDLIGTDVENVDASIASGTGTLVGDGRANTLTVRDGRGDITGGDGTDVLQGDDFDDTFHARDGTPDTILCAGGFDTVEADTVDTVSSTCENVSAQATPGGAFDDRPPLLAWSSPAANASLSADAASVLRVDASDDRGLAKVQFFDDDRLLCEVASAPFDCAYQPRGDDVGRNTLIAVAVDTAAQTTSVARVVTVRRFSPPSLTLVTRPSRDRTRAYAYELTGRLERPPAVAPSQGCSGAVAITAKRGARTLAARRVTLTRTCEYDVTLRFRSRVAPSLRVTARFGGNEVLATRTAPSRTIRLG